MIELKDAVHSAETFLRAHINPAELKHLRLEEVELSEDERYWKITLGWVEPASRQASSGALTFNRPEILALPRTYKQFLVDTTTGNVKSMKIFEG